MTNVCVWNAGDSKANGSYEEQLLADGKSVIQGGKRCWKKGELQIFWNNEMMCWSLQASDEEVLYINEEDEEIPPAEKWQMHDGAAPAPSISSDEHKSKSAPVCKAALNMNLWGLNSLGYGINIEQKDGQSALSKYKGFYNRMSMYPRCLVSNISMTPEKWAERTKGMYWVQRTRSANDGDHYIIYASCANALRLGTRHRGNWNRAAANKYTPTEFDKITWEHDTKFTLPLPEAAREWSQQQMEDFMRSPEAQLKFQPKAELGRSMEELKFMDLDVREAYDHPVNGLDVAAKLSDEIEHAMNFLTPQTGKDAKGKDLKHTPRGASRTSTKSSTPVTQKIY